MKKTTLIASLLAFSSITAFAADYYVVVPSLGKTSVPTEPAAPPAPTITLTLNGYPLPAALVGRAYAGFDFNTVLQVSGDASFDGQAVSWTLVGGALPEGLTLGADGVLAGTPTAAGNASFQVKASYKTTDGTQAFELLTGEVQVALAGATLPAAVQGAAYFHDFKPQLSVSGDPAFNVSQVLWTLEGALPQGLVLNADGTITGVPTAEGSYPFTVRAQYLNQQGAQTHEVFVAEAVVSGNLVAEQGQDFGEVQVGDEVLRRFSFTNGGNSTAKGMHAAVAGAHLTLVEPTTCGTAAAPVELAPEAKCTFTVRYAPSAAGSVSGSAALHWTGPRADSRSLSVSGAAKVDYSALMNGFTQELILTAANINWVSGRTWYWTVENAAAIAPAGFVEFRQAITVPGVAPITAYLEGAVDNRFVRLELNGALVAENLDWDFMSVKQTGLLTLQPGVNVVSIQIENVHSTVGSGANPAGMSVSIRKADGTLLGAESGWKF